MSQSAWYITKKNRSKYILLIKEKRLKGKLKQEGRSIQVLFFLLVFLSVQKDMSSFRLSSPNLGFQQQPPEPKI